MTQVPASWFNAVARFVNNFVGGFGVKVERRDRATVVSVDPDALGLAKEEESTAVESVTEPASTSRVTSGISSAESSAYGEVANWTGSDEDAKGLRIEVITRAKYDGTSVSFFSRQLTFRGDGRLYSVSGEGTSMISCYQDTSQ